MNTYCRVVLRLCCVLCWLCSVQPTIIQAQNGRLPKMMLPKGRAIVNLSIQHTVAGALLALDSTLYSNEHGQRYSISKFKYYISNISLQRADGKKFITKDYFLVNEEETASKHIELRNVPEGEYTSLSFTLGVDSVHNCSGVQQGALDPVHGMFWAWNTGYIFLKVEGKADASRSPGHTLEYHIGGFKQPYNCIRTIILPLAEGKTGLKVQAKGKATLYLQADVAQIFKVPTAIDFAELSSVTDAHNSTLMADNYADMFSLVGLQQ